MQKVKNSISNGRKLLLGSGKTASIFQCSLLALLYSYSRMLSMPVYFIAPTVLLAVAIPLLLMPFIYNLINDISFISTGKYHLVFAVVTLLFAGSYANLFSIDEWWSFPVKALTLFFSLTMSILFFLTYASVLSSIVSRVYSKNEKRADIINSAFTFIGAAAVTAAVVFERTDSLYSQLGYAGGCVILITGFAAYLASAAYMPRFIRLEVPKKRDLFTKYSKFFMALSTKENRRVFIYYFLMCVCFQILALMTLQSESFTGAETVHLAAAGGLFLAGAAAAAVLARRFKKNNSAAVLLLSIFCAIPSLIFIVTGFSSLAAERSVLILLTAATLYGVSVGLFYTVSSQYFNEVFDRSSTTRGTLVNIKNMLFFAAFVFSFASVSIAGISVKYFVPVAASVSFAFLAGAFILKTAKKRYLTLDYPEGLNDLGIKN